MALDFLGGIAGAYQAIQKGIDDSKERDYLGKRRQWQEEDRAAQLEDREYNRGQRQRTLDEQRRADRLRDADAAIPFEIDVGSSAGAPPTAAKPGGINQKPPAVATPAAPTVTPMPMVDSAPMDASSAMPQVDAQATDAKATTPMVGDQAQQPKALPKRRITYGEYLRQLSKNRRDVGQTGAAMELEQKADQWSLDQAGKRLNSLIGASSSMPLEQFANEAAKMFNEDPLPQSIRGIRVNEDGSVTASISMSDGRYSTEQTFKSKGDMIQALQSFYQPENFAKLQQAAAEARAKAREELMKPRTIKPGETVQVFNPDTGKYQVIAEGRIPAGYEVVEGANGETMLRRFDSGRGAGKGAKVDASPWIDIIDKLSNSDEDKPFRTTAAANSELISQLNSKVGLPPAVIANVGLQYAKNPEAATVTFDPQTGSWGKTIDFQGRRVVVNDRVKPEEVEKALPAQADALYTQLKSSNDPLLSVVQNPQERARWESGKINSIAASLAKASGRNAIDPEVQKQAKAVFEAQDRPRLESISGLLSKSQLATKDAKDAADKASGGSRSPWGGGLRPSSNYAPPPDSPVGKMRARNEKLAAQRAEAEKAASEQRAAASTVATETADKVIASGDRRAARALQSSKEFDLLPREQKLQIWEIVNGVAR